MNHPTIDERSAVRVWWRCLWHSPEYCRYWQEGVIPDNPGDFEYVAKTFGNVWKRRWFSQWWRDEGSHYRADDAEHFRVEELRLTPEGELQDMSSGIPAGSYYKGSEDSIAFLAVNLYLYDNLARDAINNTLMQRVKELKGRNRGRKEWDDISLDLRLAAKADVDVLHRMFVVWRAGKRREDDIAAGRLALWQIGDQLDLQGPIGDPMVRVKQRLRKRNEDEEQRRKRLGDQVWKYKTQWERLMYHAVRGQFPLTD